MCSASASSDVEISLPFGLPGAPEIHEFIGREAELSAIKEAFKGDDALRRTVILHGLGGIGKTQLAVSYATQHRNEYHAIFWLNGKDEDTLKQSFISAAQRLCDEHPSSTAIKAVLENPNQSEITKAMLRWLGLRKNSGWLLIYDNVDDPKLPGSQSGAYDLKMYMPVSHHGHILITTRSSELKLGKMIRVQKLSDIEQSIEILTRTSGRSDTAKGKFLDLFTASILTAL